MFPWRTVGPEHRRSASSTGASRAAERERRVREAIRLAGLEGFEDAFPATLSGGMRQRVALMRTLVVEPEILLMDEPFGALDTHTKLHLHGAAPGALGRRKRQTVVFVTHDLAEAITLADRVIVLTRRPGRVKLIHEVKLPRPRDVIVRETDEYAREFSALWHVLGEEFAEAERSMSPRRRVSDRAV